MKRSIHFKGKPFSLKGSLPAVGSKASPFSLVNSRMEKKSLEDFKEKIKIIATVPSLDTPVCLLSAKKLAEQAALFSDVVFIVISADLPFAQNRSCLAENLDKLELLSTLGSPQFAEHYGIAIDDSPLQGLCARAIFVLSPDNQICYRELVDELSSEPNYEKAYQAVQDLRK